MQMQALSLRKPPIEQETTVPGAGGHRRDAFSRLVRQRAVGTPTTPAGVTVAAAPPGALERRSIPQAGGANSTTNERKPRKSRSRRSVSSAPARMAIFRTSIGGGSCTRAVTVRGADVAGGRRHQRPTRATHRIVLRLRAVAVAGRRLRTGPARHLSWRATLARRHRPEQVRTIRLRLLTRTATNAYFPQVAHGHLAAELRGSS